jgi:hypothetical protein
MEDAALSPDLVCETRAGAWLYRCAPAVGGKAAGALCRHRPRYWPHSDMSFLGSGSGGLLFFEVEVGEGGSLLFNGKPVDLTELRGNLASAALLQPSPPLVLHASASSDCQTTERVRALLDKHPTCGSGLCFEGDYWRELGFPSFAEHESRFAPVERRPKQR